MLLDRELRRRVEQLFQRSHLPARRDSPDESAFALDPPAALTVSNSHEQSGPMSIFKRNSSEN
jgi:hypothetical protein